MALNTARSTPSQRARLQALAVELKAALDALPARFWAGRSEIEAYTTVLRHIERWIAWEGNDND